MITLIDPTIDELQAVITAMVKVHPGITVTGTLSISRAGDAVRIDTDDQVDSESSRAVVPGNSSDESPASEVAEVADPPRLRPRRTIDRPKRTVSPKADDEVLARVAELEREAGERGLAGDRRYQHVAKGIGRSESAAKNLIYKAIQAGLIERRDSPLGKIDKRPFDADAARMRAVAAL